VGGIPEIYGFLSSTLVPPADSAALAGAISQALDSPDTMLETAHRLRAQVMASFSTDRMVDGVLGAYRTALGTLVKNGRR
jgi:glycosyltransferase involved in cell wall biosynthesis